MFHIRLSTSSDFISCVNAQKEEIVFNSTWELSAFFTRMLRPQLLVLCTIIFDKLLPETS